MASDGLFDVMEDQSVIDAVGSHLKEHKRCVDDYYYYYYYCYYYCYYYHCYYFLKEHKKCVTITTTYLRMRAVTRGRPTN